MKPKTLNGLIRKLRRDIERCKSGEGYVMLDRGDAAEVLRLLEKLRASETLAESKT